MGNGLPHNAEDNIRILSNLDGALGKLRALRNERVALAERAVVLQTHPTPKSPTTVHW